MARRARSRSAPPRLQARAEVSLRPWGHQDVAVGRRHVRQGQGQGRGAAHDLAV
eukprot:CAMPEP_0204234766 /NCGR_PEP_ID=MMETSP0361-20130328/91193_1 /ASSEMBLY_ACC=CAM_ASM_000343 /TAXON_ID=268821 /ORGANISM="Scrippsiella Hangoei, Strain SHTV-5" /LENGTH=53 /DNA_ID=CAMNT_0051205871 /DNA_START=38 /DNA_END=195 /DNA_ORIENTATION=-